jgi:hypothetical protein
MSGMRWWAAGLTMLGLGSFAPIAGQGPAKPAAAAPVNSHVVPITDFMAKPAPAFAPEDTFWIRLRHRIPFLRTSKQPEPPKMNGPVGDITAGIPDGKK